MGSAAVPESSRCRGGEQKKKKAYYGVWILQKKLSKIMYTQKGYMYQYFLTTLSHHKQIKKK